MSFARSAYLTLCCLLVSAGPSLAQAGADQPKISVVGAGTVTTFPNAAQITVLVKFTRPTLREAVTENQRTARNVLTILKKYVADTTEIKTSLIATDKAMKWDRVQKKDVVTGFEASQRIIFTLSDLQRMQRFTEEVLKTRIYELERISYFHTEGAQFMKQAQEMAVRDAIESTGRLARAGNLKQGRILYLETGDSPSDGEDETVESYNFQAFSKAIGGRGVTSSGQLITYRATVTLHTAIE